MLLRSGNFSLTESRVVKFVVSREMSLMISAQPLVGINSHYEISQNNLAPCGIICIFTQDRGNGGYLFLSSLLCKEANSRLWLSG